MPLHSGSVFCDGSSRKRARQISETPLEDPTPWVYHPTYGVVHPSGCGVCDAYTTHLVEAERQSSYQLALKDRDRKHDLYFFDGVSEGRRRQRDDDEYLYEERERYRGERNEALEEMSRYKIDCHSMRVEIRLLTDQLHATQDECAGLRHSLEITSRSKKVEPTHQFLRIERMEVDTTLLYPQDSLPLEPKITSTRTSASQPMEEIQSTPNIDESISGRPQSFSASRGLFTYAAVASSQPSVTSPTISMSKRLTVSTLDHHVANLPARPNPSVPHVDSRATVAQNTNGQAPRNPKTVRQLQSLMTAAHKPGNEGALAKIKALCAEAHSTPRELKTELQRYLLSNWRNPNLSTESTFFPRTIPLIPAKMNPRMDDPVETWFEYLSTHHGSWPRGVRRDSRNRPFMSDLKASRAVARLRPDIDTTGAVASRSEFLACVTELFSTPGTYKKCIEQNGLTVAPATCYRPYHGSTPITLDAIVHHFADCGVTREAAAEEFEPWSQSYQDAAPNPLNGSKANEGALGSTSRRYDN